MAYKTMLGQAGMRIVISYALRGKAFACTTHYANEGEFWDRVRAEDLDLAWYQVKGHDRKVVTRCDLCHEFHSNGTSGNCGN